MNAKVEKVAENPVGKHANITNEKAMKLNEKARSEKRSHAGLSTAVIIFPPPIADKLFGNVNPPNHSKSTSPHVIY